MILLYDIVKIFALANFYLSMIFLIKPIDANYISSTFIYIDHARLAITANGFVKETRPQRWYHALQRGGNQSYSPVYQRRDNTSTKDTQ